MDIGKYLDCIVRKDMEIEDLRANLTKMMRENIFYKEISENATNKEKDLEKDLRDINDKYNKIRDYCVEFENSFRELTSVVDDFFKKGDLADFRESFIKVVDKNSSKIGSIKIR